MKDNNYLLLGKQLVKCETLVDILAIGWYSAKNLQKIKLKRYQIYIPINYCTLVAILSGAKYIKVCSEGENIFQIFLPT